MSDPLILTWHDFDAAVDSMALALSEILASSTWRASGIYGIPRGGLMLAVPLSHRLMLPLFSQPQHHAIVVDDVIETGRAMDAACRGSGIIAYRCVAWCTKIDTSHDWLLRVPPERWIIFPWEPLERAQADAEAYYASRQ